MNDIQERIKTIKSSLKCSNQKELALKMGVNETRVKSLESGRAKEFKSDEIETLVEKFDFNAYWLLTGKGEKYLNSEISTPKPIESKEDNRDSEDFIPFYDKFVYLDNQPKIRVFLNQPKRIYKDNPLLGSLLYDENDLLSKNIVIGYGYNSLNVAYKQKDSNKIIDYYLNLQRNFSFLCILKNNLFEKDNPLYDNKYFGAEWCISNDESKDIRCEATVNDDKKYSIAIDITREEFSKLTILGLIVSLEDLKLFNDD